MDKWPSEKDKDMIEQKKQQWDGVYSGPKEKIPWVENPIPKAELKLFIEHLPKNKTVLDYGSGDGILADFLFEQGLDISCCDVSKKAIELVNKKMPNVETWVAFHPSQIEKKGFGGLLAWGVMHHLPRERWESYIDTFIEMTSDDAVMLFGGHSMKDKDFVDGKRISPTTGEESFAIDFMEDLLKDKNLEIIESGYFPFKEAYSDNERCFKYFLVKKR